MTTEYKIIHDKDGNAHVVAENTIEEIHIDVVVWPSFDGPEYDLPNDLPGQ